MAYTPFKFPQQPTLQQTLSRTPGYFGPLMPPQPKWWQIMQQKSPYSFKGMPVVKPPMPGNPNFVGPLQPPAVPQPSDPNFVGPTQNQGMLPSATPSPNAIPKNQKAAIIMGALSDIFRGQDPTQNTVVRQQQMVAMEERAKKERALAKTMRGETLTESDKIDLFGTKLYADIEAERIRAKESGSSGTSLMDNVNYIDDLYIKRDKYAPGTKPYNDLTIKIRNAEAGIGAYKYDPQRQGMLASATTAAEQGFFGEQPLTKAQVKSDDAFGTWYTNEWLLKGGGSTEQTYLENLKGVRDVLVDAEKSGESISGISEGILTKYPAANAYFNEEGAIAQDRIASVAQLSLKAILGGQFSEREGELLIQRAYNPLLSEAENIERLTQLINRIEKAENYKGAAAKYYEDNGTIAGFKAQKYDEEDFRSDIEDFYKQDMKLLSDDALEQEFLNTDASSIYFKILEEEVRKRNQ